MDTKKQNLQIRNGCGCGKKRKVRTSNPSPAPASGNPTTPIKDLPTPPPKK